jgi:hypothetical protein
MLIGHELGHSLQTKRNSYAAERESRREGHLPRMPIFASQTTCTVPVAKHLPEDKRGNIGSAHAAQMQLLPPRAVIYGLACRHVKEIDNRGDDFERPRNRAIAG